MIASRGFGYKSINANNVGGVASKLIAKNTNGVLDSVQTGIIMGATIAGWSSLEARRAHNPKVVGSNPTPATSLNNRPFGEYVEGLSFSACIT